MKRLFIIMMCLVLMFSVAACGKDKEKTEEDVKLEQSVTEEETGREETGETKDGGVVVNEEDTKTVVVESAEDLGEIVDEFNTTTDPERKEELREELEKIFAQAEAAAEQQ